MNKDSQTVKPLSAPKVDNLIYQAEKQYEISDGRTKALVNELFRKLQSITACGEDEQRKLWLTAPRGSIEEFGYYKIYLEDGEVESREEFEKLWLSEYPDPQKWYLLSTTVYKDIFSVFINGKLVLQILPESELQRQYPCDKSELAGWLLDAANNTIASLKRDAYNKYVRINLPYRKRIGKILRQDYWRIFPDEKAAYLKDIKPAEIHRFISLINEQPTDKPLTRLSEMTAGLFFNCCRLGYESNGYEGTERLTSKELYYTHADGRDEGLSELDESSAEAFSTWYHDKTHQGGHPWEVCRGGNSTHISLYVHHDEKGWWLRLTGSSAGRSVETVKFYLALSEHGLPVYLDNAIELAAMLMGKDYIGIVPEDVLPAYCSSLFPDEKTLDFMNLPWEETEQVIKAAIWYPVTEVLLNDNTDN